jgi:hypothetical protein|tara:strand:- start:687 stop:854 length:168 start_codon:yes stop_codon:yes gene_type:complete
MNINEEEMVYENLEDAITDAKELCDVMETYVKITKGLKGGFELFGSGEFIMEIKE